MGPVGFWLLLWVGWEAIQELTECHDPTYVLKVTLAGVLRINERWKEGQLARYCLRMVAWTASSWGGCREARFRGRTRCLGWSGLERLSRPGQTIWS